MLSLSHYLILGAILFCYQRRWYFPESKEFDRSFDGN
jgi:hypothetical protein